MRPAGKILVTGGAGFIGSHLVEHLLGQGEHVVVLDDFSNGRRENLEFGDGDRKLEIIEGDIVDAATCQWAMRGVDRVFHLACFGVRHSLHSPVENHQVNALGSLNMLEAARTMKVERFIYVSTSEIYGRVQEFPITENCTPWPLTVYGSSKLAGEHYARAYAECYRLPVVCVRPFNNYGPRSHFEGDSGEVIPRFILRALAGLPPVIFGDGSHTRDFLYVTDCAEALSRIAASNALLGEVVNLGYGDEIRLDDLASIVLDVVGRPELAPILEEKRPADVPKLWADTTRLRKAIGFQPKVSLREGIAHTVDYFRKFRDENPEAVAIIKTKNWET